MRPALSTRSAGIGAETLANLRLDGDSSDPCSPTPLRLMVVWPPRPWNKPFQAPMLVLRAGCNICRCAKRVGRGFRHRMLPNCGFHELLGTKCGLPNCGSEHLQLVSHLKWVQGMSFWNVRHAALCGSMLRTTTRPVCRPVCSAVPYCSAPRYFALHRTVPRQPASCYLPERIMF